MSRTCSRQPPNFLLSLRQGVNPKVRPLFSTPRAKGEREGNIWSFSITTCLLLPQFILAPQWGEGRDFPSEPPRSPLFRIREEPFPGTNILAVKHLDLHKGQPAKRELGPPKRAGLGRVPRLGKGPQGRPGFAQNLPLGPLPGHGRG